MELLRSTQIVDMIVVRHDATSEVNDLALQFAALGVPVFDCNEKDMALAANTVTPQSILARVLFHQVKPKGNRVVLLDGVSDPGNVGTIIRCAAWFGFTDVVLAAKSADVYNPKVVRASAGSMLRMNVHRHVNAEEFISSAPSYSVVSAVPHGGEPPSILSSLEPLILVIGNEAHGVSANILSQTNHQVTIPGQGNVESLNAAMAATILLYEGGRTQ